MTTLFCSALSFPHCSSLYKVPIGKRQVRAQPPIIFYLLKFCLTLLPPHITRKENPMEQIPDDPIIASMLRTGWPPWMLTAGADDDGMDQD